MQFEAVKPADRGLPASGTARKHFVARDSQILTNLQSGCINKRNPGTTPAFQMQIAPQRDQHITLAFDKTVVSGQLGKLSLPILTNKSLVKGFQVAKPGDMKHHEQRHHFGIAQRTWFTPLPLPVLDQHLIKARLEYFTKVVNFTKNS